MNWFTSLFRRKPKAPPPITECPMTEPRRCGLCSLQYVCIDPRKDEPEPFERPKPGCDIIGRQGGHNAKRNRVHIYRQPYGYPIRACDWVFADKSELEILAECQGPDGGVENMTLIFALDYQVATKGVVICKNCRAFAQGKRTSIGMENHGHGKGADIER